MVIRLWKVRIQNTEFGIQNTEKTKKKADCGTKKTLFSTADPRSSTKLERGHPARNERSESKNTEEFRERKKKVRINGQNTKLERGHPARNERSRIQN